jgi:hypothetical protein
MKCFISVKHAKGNYGEWTEAKNLPEYTLAESDSNRPVIRIGERIFRFNSPAGIGSNPQDQNPENFIQQYRLLPKGTVVVLIQE